MPFSLHPSLFRLSAVALTVSAATSVADDPKESDYYQIQAIPNPDKLVLEVGALEHTPEGRIFATTRRGDVFTVTDALGPDVSTAKLKLFAGGLHEVLGATWNEKNQSLYITQRPEVTRLHDDDGDGRADTFETVCDGWGITGDYHEYAFGSKFDPDGNMWVVLCLTGSFTSDTEYRGWGLRITPDGRMLPSVCGIRSPGGIGFNAAGDAFYTDNQGPWNGSSSLKWLKPGSFAGNPTGNKWFSITTEIGPRPPEPHDQSRMVTEREHVPTLVPPAVMLPHAHLGQSPTAIICDRTGGKFGPFKDQLFVSEQTFSNIARVSLEKVNGVYQGVAIPFLEGFGSGLIGMTLTDSGILFAGGSDRGWGSRGGKPYSFDRVVWTGKTPFEILNMTAEPDGFTLSFTAPVNKETAGDPASYAMRAWTWAYRQEYGGPEVDQVKPVISAATVSSDGMKVRLKAAPLTKGHVHYLQSPGVRSADGVPLLHGDAYYTLNEIPASGS
ncbi:MAG: putative rane-bound dehydrogenase domain protein [Verrucomicrobiales bacterium]|nr:putative rane-bound dehydrogenase domain protein [Verrucomicrobiales bacterium]